MNCKSFSLSFKSDQETKPHDASRKLRNARDFRDEPLGRSITPSFVTSQDLHYFDYVPVDKVGISGSMVLASALENRSFGILEYGEYANAATCDLLPRHLALRLWSLNSFVI